MSRGPFGACERAASPEKGPPEDLVPISGQCVTTVFRGGDHDVGEKLVFHGYGVPDAIIHVPESSREEVVDVDGNSLGTTARSAFEAVELPRVQDEYAHGKGRRNDFLCARERDAHRQFVMIIKRYMEGRHTGRLCR